MKRLSFSLALIGLLASGGYAIAADPAGPPVYTKRQAIKNWNCMSKEMAAHKSLSYIDATKACMERIRSRASVLARDQTRQ